MKTQASKKNGAGAQPGRRWPSSVPRLLCVVLGAGLVALLQAVWEFPHKRPAPRELAKNIVEGPWGRLELTPFFLEKPPEMLPDPGTNLDAPRWHFVARTKGQTIGFLESCPLTPAQLRALTEGDALSEASEGCWLTPTPAAVLSISQESRERIYAELEKSPENMAVRHPFRIRTEDAGLWLHGVGLSEEKVQLIRRLLYRRGDVLCFSDTAVAKTYFAPHEFSALLRALYSSDTLLVRLRVQTNDPIDRIAAYWGRGGREESLKALLKSAARNPGGIQIDLDSLLPPLPRTWLYTYPSRPQGAPSAGDCYWTSLNFFRSAAEDRFLDPTSRTSEFRNNYRLVSHAERLGDVIVFADARGITQHACVYVAADIVFTKNGAQNTHPWVLMRLDQVRAMYGEPGSQMLVFSPRGS